MYQLHIPNYTSDKESKDAFRKAFEKFLSQFGYTYFSWEGVESLKDENGKIISMRSVELGKESVDAEIDFILMVVDDDNDFYHFAIELKERKKDEKTGAPLFNDSYGTFAKAGWMLECKKKDALDIASYGNLSPLYVNVYADGIYRVWNTDNIPESEKYVGSLNAPVSTEDLIRGNIDKPVIFLKNADGWTFNGEGKTEHTSISGLIYTKPLIEDPRDIFE